MTLVGLRDAFMPLLPILSAILLVGGAIGGSMLPRHLRAAIERWVIWPTLIVVGLGFAAWGVVESDPRMVISGTLSALLAVFFLRRNIKNKGANGAPEAPKGMEPTA